MATLLVVGKLGVRVSAEQWHMTIDSNIIPIAAMSYAWHIKLDGGGALAPES